MANYRPTPLYGSALQCPLPASFADVSDIRQVPDHQEVWLDTEGFTSVVFDILERVEGVTDVEALQVHLEDIVGEEKHVKILAKGEVQMQKLPTGTPAYALMATSPPGEKQRGRANEPDFVVLLVLLIRLVKQKTDVIATVNVPHVPGTYDAGEVNLEGGRWGPLVSKGMEIRERIVEGLEIRDWGLFGEDDGAHEMQS